MPPSKTQMQSPVSLLPNWVSVVPGIDTVTMNFGLIDLQAAEIFKIRGGEIHEIEAMGYLLPCNAKTGWE